MLAVFLAGFMLPPVVFPYAKLTVKFDAAQAKLAAVKQALDAEFRAEMARMDANKNRFKKP